MPRRCERPGCSLPADVAYGFDADQSSVWLEAVTQEEAERVNAGVLCRRHADALRPARGWFLDDRREILPRLFPAPAVEGPARPRSRRERSSRAQDTTDELPFLMDPGPQHGSREQQADDPASEPPAEPAVAVAVHAEVDHDEDSRDPGDDLDETEALPWTPVFDQTDDLDGLLDARGPLLSRAFGRRTGPGTPATGAR